MNDGPRLVGPAGEVVVLREGSVTRTRAGLQVVPAEPGESVIVWPAEWQEAAPAPPELVRDPSVIEALRRGRLGPAATASAGPYRGGGLAPLPFGYAVVRTGGTVSSADALRDARRERWAADRVARFVQQAAEVIARAPMPPLHPDPTTFLLDDAGNARVRSNFLEWVLDLAAPGDRAPPRRWLGHRPPETLRTGARATRRSSSPTERAARSVYVLGVLAWELISGQPLFEVARDRETLVRVARAEVPPLTSIAPGAPSELAAWIHTMIGRDPRRRPTLDAVEAAMRPHAGEAHPPSVAPDALAVLRE